MKKIAILGSTGSIGTQTLDVVRQHRDQFEVFLISAGSNAELLAEQAREFDVPHVVICDENRYNALRASLEDTDSKVWAGVDSICELVKSDSVDIVVGAMVGFSGLRPTLSALEAGKIVALANKETLVAAGSIVTRTMREHNAVILPVDSEHSAIFQCLMGAVGNDPEKILLTASGGPFRTWTKERIAGATAAQALKHPNWSMGAKVTIDSSTMMNKGFELIEAHWLFGMAPDRIEVVVHPESVIHSMVQFRDGAVIAQLASPDMRQPIGFALGFPERITVGARKLDFGTLSSLTFEKPDLDRFPCLRLAIESIKKGGNVPCALNAANEIAVKAFLEGRISFYGIAELCEKSLTRLDFIAEPTLEDIFTTDKEIRDIANGCLD